MGSSSSSNVKPLVAQKQALPLSSTRVRPASQPSGRRTSSSVSSVHDITEDASIINLPTQCTPKIIEVVSRPSSNTKRLTCNETSNNAKTSDILSAVQDDVINIKSDVDKEVSALKIQNSQLEKQLCELETHNLDYAERVQLLEEQLETERRMVILNEATPCVNTINIKDQCISKLEQETDEVRKEMGKLKTKYKKKIRQMNAQLLEAKHESSVTMCETKAELQRLKRENVSLLRKAKAISIREEGDYPETPVGSSGLQTERTGLILDLSGQVSAQEKKILELELVIQDRDKMINDLVHDEKSLTFAGKVDNNRKWTSNYGGINEDTDNWSVDGGDARSALLKSKHVDDDENSEQLAEMKAIAREIKQLGTRKKSKKKHPLRGRAKTQHTETVALPDSRESSGTSRDSGFASGDCDAFKSKPKSKWVSSGEIDTDLNVLNMEDKREDGAGDLELQQNVSPESGVSRWSDDEVDECSDRVGEKTSALPISSIRRTSAPKKKKKHVFSENDELDSLLSDFDNTHSPSPVSKSGTMFAKENIREYSLSPLTTAQ